MTRHFTDEDVVALFPGFDSIDDQSLRSGGLRIVSRCISDGHWDDPTTLPFLPEFMGTRHDNIHHTNEVARVASGIAREMLLGDDRGLMLDLVLTSALIHDASKWIEYQPTPDGDRTVLSPEGMALRHPFRAVEMATEFGMPDEVVNAVAAHSVGNDIVPTSVVGVIIHHADMIVMDAALLDVGLPSVCNVRRDHQQVELPD